MSAAEVIQPVAETAKPVGEPQLPVLEKDPSYEGKLVCQPKLSVGSPDDPFEKEADAVADTIMQSPQKSFVKKKCEACEEDEKAGDPIIQTKPDLSIGPPDDAYEKEADTVADTVLQMKEADDQLVQREQNDNPPITGADIDADPNKGTIGADPIDKDFTLDLNWADTDFLRVNTELGFRNVMLQDTYSRDAAIQYEKLFQWSKRNRLGTILQNLNQVKGLNLLVPDLDGNDPDKAFANKLLGSQVGSAIARDNPSFADKNSSTIFNFYSFTHDFLGGARRKCADCEDEEKEDIQRKPETSFLQAKANDAAPVTDTVADSIQSSKGSGSAMDGHTGSFMQRRFGVDFSNVRIHTGTEAVQMSRELNAKAFTTGNDIYFNEGQYQPGSDSGKHLLAHELTHVIQQNHTASSTVVQRDPLKDEEKKYAINYETAQKRNVDDWHAKYKFFNLFVKTPYGDREGIGPGSTPVAYANHVYELQKELKAIFDKYNGSVNGILDDDTINWGYTLANEYKKNKDVIAGRNVDTTILDRLLHVEERQIKNPEVMYSAFFNYEQFKMIMTNKAFVLSIGDKGEHVKFLNMVLNEWGYLFVPGKEVPDVYDNSTWSAVKQFQTDTGVATIDGNVGYGTLHLMDLKLAGRASILTKPGTYSFVYERLSGKPVIFIDGDGDQKKELKLTFGKSGDNVTVKVMHTDTKEEKGPFSFSFPGLDLNDVMLIKERRSTEGVRTSEIQLLYAGAKKKQEGEEKPPEYIIPITPSSSVGDGNYKIGDNAIQFNVEKIQSIPSMDYAMEEKKINPELTLTLGQYNDVVSLFFKGTEATENEEAKDNKETRTYDAELNVIGVSKLNKVFKPGIALKLKNAKLSLSVITAGLNFVGIDLDSDGEEDIRIYTRVTQRELDKDASKLRNVFLLFTGPAIATETEMGFGKRGEAYIFSEEDKSEEIFKQMVASEGEAKLSQQTVAGSAQEEINQLNQLIGQVYLKALEEKIISPDTYLAWKKLEISMAYINLFIKGNATLTNDDEDKISKTATFADEYFALIKRDAGDKNEITTYSGGGETSTTITSNAYTTEYEIANDNTTEVTKYEVKLGEEIRAKKWTQANRTLHQLAGGFNQWVAYKFKEKNPADTNLPAQTTGLFKYMQAITGLRDNANVKHLTRLKSLYFSYQQFTQKPGLPAIDLPLWYYYDSDSEKWWIIDFINPNNPFKEEISQDKEDAGNTPPHELFEKLNSKYHLPKGIVLYANPEGTAQGKIEMTEPWEWKDVLTWAAVILGGAALIGSIIFSGGAATPVAIPVLFALSAIAGGAAAAISLYDRIRKEDYDPLGIMLDVGTIAASIVGLGALGSGKIIVTAGQAAAKGAPWAGNWAKLALLADQYYTPLVMAGIGIDGFNLAILGADTINKLKAIDDDGQYANDNDKTRAKILLLSQLIFAGGLTILSLKGSLPAINGKQNLVLMPGKDGIPIATTPEAWFKHAEAGDIAARSDEQFGQTLQVREPLFGKEAIDELKKIKNTSASARIEQLNKMILDTLNNPTLSVEAKKDLATQYIKEMEGLVATTGMDKSKFKFAASLDVVGKLTESNFGMRMVMRQGKIFIEGTEAGTFGDLLQKVKAANAASKAAGTNTELVVINNEIGEGAYEVLVLTRERWQNPPSGFKGEHFTDLGKVNPGKQQFIIDVGSGETSFAKDTIRPEDIQGSTIINTEYAPKFMSGAQTRSDLTWKNAAAGGTDGNTVALLGDPLKNMNQIAGNKNVRQVFISNVNAGYKESDYRKLAEQLLLSMDDGGRVMVQWDMKPEKTGAPGPQGLPGSRNHIIGEELDKALQDLAATYGRKVETLKDLQPVDYKYGITPSTRKEYPPGSEKNTEIGDPIPEKRWDFVFK